MEFFDDLWKAELKQFRDEFENGATAFEADSMPERRFFELERPLLYSAFIIRKLIEDGAVTDALKGSWIETIEHASSRNGEPVFIEAMIGPLNVEDHFDLAQGQVTRISFNDLASEIIHSDGLVWVPLEDRLDGFMVFSYRNALKRLLFVEATNWLGCVDTVLADAPSNWSLVKDLKTGRISREVS